MFTNQLMGEPTTITKIGMKLMEELSTIGWGHIHTVRAFTGGVDCGGWRRWQGRRDAMMGDDDDNSDAKHRDGSGERLGAGSFRICAA